MHWSGGGGWLCSGCQSRETWQRDGAAAGRMLASDRKLNDAPHVGRAARCSQGCSWSEVPSRHDSCSVSCSQRVFDVPSAMGCRRCRVRLLGLPLPLGIGPHCRLITLLLGRPAHPRDGLGCPSARRQRCAKQAASLRVAPSPASSRRRSSASRVSVATRRAAHRRAARCAAPPPAALPRRLLLAPAEQRSACVFPPFGRCFFGRCGGGASSGRHHDRAGEGRRG